MHQLEAFSERVFGERARRLGLGETWRGEWRFGSAADEASAARWRKFPKHSRMEFWKRAG